MLQKRKAIVHPLVSNSPSNSPYTNSKIADGLDENCRHCRNVLSAWKRDLTKLLVLDLYLFNPDNNSYILIERWKICYQKTADNRDYKPFGFINRRVLTLIRTMYCFIRLLPAFHQLHYCPNLPTFGFQIYDPNQSYSNGQSIHNFKYDTTKYKFNPVSTSKGYLHVGVTFVTPNNVGVSVLVHHFESLMVILSCSFSYNRRF